MSDQITETLPWVEAQDLRKEITLELLSCGVDWLKGDFRKKWKEMLHKRDSLERFRGGTREKTLEVCTQLADLQRDLAYYLFLVSRSRDALKKLEKPITEVLFGEDANSVVNCLGAERRGYVEASLVGAISNLTFWHLIAGSSPELVGRLSFEQMVVGGVADAGFAMDAVLDFGTKIEGKKVLRVIQLKADRYGQMAVVSIYPDDLKVSYLGGSVSKNDAKRMINGARQFYPGCHFLFFTALVPSFDSPPVRNVFGIIHPGYPERDALLDNFKEQALKTGLLPNVVR
ncbi:MAG: hypothetical protein ACK4NX_02770 [Candidatus Paceibacteria bacterium]